MRRRDFIYASASLLLPAVARAGERGRDGIIAGGADMQTLPDGMKRVQTGDERAILRLGKNAFLIAPQTDISFEMDKAGMHVRVAQLVKGAVHSVFDPEVPQERNVITNFATIAIRGTAHYCEIEAAHARSYSCCCYGHVHIDANNGDARLTQKTTYHEAKVITAAGAIEPAPYKVPLNHYDNSLVRLEAAVGRTPRWVLPNGKLNFISPFEI